jgi:hypothetical protein
LARPLASEFSATPPARQTLRVPAITEAGNRDGQRK